jgi:hypothetical protein
MDDGVFIVIVLSSYSYERMTGKTDTFLTRRNIDALTGALLTKKACCYFDSDRLF